jgi:hypothetical protein
VLQAVSTLAHVELDDLLLPDAITERGKVLLEAVVAASAKKAVRVTRSRSPGKKITQPSGCFELPLLQSSAIVRVPVGGPRAALESLEIDGMSTAQRLAWMEQARVNAILGSCRLSLKSVQSGIRAFRAFASACVWSVVLWLRLLWSCVAQNVQTQKTGSCCPRRSHYCSLGQHCSGRMARCRTTLAT